MSLSIDGINILIYYDQIQLFNFYCFFFFLGLDNQHNSALWDFSIMVITLKHAFLYLPIKSQQDPNLKVV